MIRRRQDRRLLASALIAGLTGSLLLTGGQAWAQTATAPPSPHSTPSPSAADSTSADGKSPTATKPGTNSPSKETSTRPVQKLPTGSPEKLAAQKDLADATAKAKATGKAAPVDSQTTIYATTVANPDGSFTSTENIAPQRVKQNNAWVPVDTTLKQAADGTWQTKASVFGVTISGGGTAPLAVEDDRSGHVLTITWPTALPKPQVSGSTATYPAILPGVDLKLTATAYGVSDVLVIHDAKAAANPALKTLHLGMSSPGLTVTATESGGLKATDKDGKDRFTGSTPMMWDSATAPAAKAAGTPDQSSNTAAPDTNDITKSPAMTSHLAKMPITAGGNGVDFRPDATMLGDPGTVYPVYLDPDITPVYSNERAEIWQCGDTEYINGAGQTGSLTMRVGWNSCGGLVRGMLQFDSRQLWTVENVPEDIDWANISILNQFQCTPVTVYRTGPIQSGVTWSNQGSKAIWSGNGAGPIPGGSLGCPSNNKDQTWTFSDLQQARDAASHDWSTITLGFQATNEANHSTANYMAYYASSTGYWGTGEPKLTAHWWASPTLASYSADTAPIGNHSDTTPICGSGSNGTHYLPITSTPINLHLGVTDQDAGHPLTLGYELQRYDGTDITPPNGWNETISYDTPGVVKNFDVPLAYNFTDGQSYRVIPYVGDPLTGVSYYPLPTYPGAAGCYFTAATSPPNQPTFSTTTYQRTGQHLASYPTVGTGGTLTVNATAPNTPIVRFDWALNTASTNEGDGHCTRAGNNCGSVNAGNTTNTSATISIPAGAGNGEHWGNNYIYVSAVDAAGNVSAYARFDFFEAQAFQPVSFGNVTGDGTPNIMSTDSAGNLVIYPANRDMSKSTDPNATAAANAIQVAPANTAPNGSSWTSALYTHRGAEVVQPTDDLFAFDHTGDGAGHMYYYRNAQTASASTQPGYHPPDTVNAYSQTQQIQVQRPTCAPATGPQCAGYNQTSWNDVKKVISLGPVNGGCDIVHPTIACKTNLITVETDGHSPARVWLFTPAGVGQLRSPVLLSTSTPTWDWASDRLTLIAPGNASHHPAPTGAPAAGGMPDLWADYDGTLWQFTNHSDTGVLGAGLGDLSAKTRLGSTDQFRAYDWVSSAGDLDGDGNPDLWTMANGRLDVLFGPLTGTIDLSEQSQTTATLMEWGASLGVTSLQGSKVTPGSVGQVVSDITGGAGGQMCLDNAYGTQSNGNVVDIYQCNGTRPQKWKFAADGTIRTLDGSGATTMCLDTGGPAVQGSKIIIYTCTNNDVWQNWRTIPSPSAPGHFWIYSPATGMCLDDTGLSNANLTQFQSWPCLDNTHAPAPQQTFALPGTTSQSQVIEAEDLGAPWGSNSGGTPQVQSHCCGGSWSNGAQLMLANTTVGSTMTINYDLAAGATYQVAPIMTKAADYGTVTVTVDGANTPLPTVFDGYQSSGVSTTQVPFGTATLAAGLHSFTFKVVGTSPNSVNARYNLGIDKLVLIPTGSSAPSPALNAPTTGLIRVPVAADASGTYPGAAPITGYTFDFGDGTAAVQQSAATATHTYLIAGTYQITATVSDGTNTITTTSAITVANGSTNEWKLNDVSGTTAPDSGNGPGKNGTLSTPGVTANPAGYASFASSGGTISTSAPTVDTTKSFSVSAWVNLAATNTGYQSMVVQRGTLHSAFYLEYNGTTWQFARALADTPGISPARITATAPAVAKTWTHLTGTYDVIQGTMAFYVNGQLVGTATDTTPMASTGPLVIGEGFVDGGANNYFDGSIADVAVYQQTLTPDQTQYLYQNSTFAKPPVAGMAGSLVSGNTDPNSAGRQLCLDDLNGSLANTTTVIDVYDCNATWPQQWSFGADGTVRLMGANPASPPNKCLDTGGYNTQGSKVTLYDCQAGNLNQVWKVLPSPTSAGQISLQNPLTGLCLDNTNGAVNNTNPFQLWSCLDNPNQHFTAPTAVGDVQRAEAESIWGSATGGTMVKQGGCCNIAWSNNAQEQFISTAAGSTMTLDYYVPNAGLYQVTPTMSKAVDFGTVAVAVDGAALATTMDGYNSTLIATPFTFGTVNLTAGIHHFTFKITGTNAASTGNRYNAGVDVLKLVPTAT
ncbi:ricin-type beta-trefoil lectin domain protein [Catenulispora yoronensis]|uniref:ricin-type beta-trefoil lectin domain protein n=1 Tax=Catenulispora yoronensis TaxID=450799 RepID=UPI0031CF6791